MMKSNSFALLLLGLCLVLFCLSNITKGQNKYEQIDKLLHTYYEYGLFNGSVLVAERNRVIYEKGFGYANFEWNIPNTPDTKFRIGSVSKQFTAMLIMQLVEGKKLKLETKVAECYPDYPEPQGSRITIHELLTHRSGIPNFTSFFNFRKDRKPYSPDELIEVFSHRELEFEPGTEYKYSNSNYVLLGAILEKVTGKTYSALLKENIFIPSDMTESGYYNDKELVFNRASGYDRLGGITNAQYIDLSVAYAAGGIYSTVRDLFKWNNALHTHKLLKKRNMEIYFKPALGNYACGWGVRNVQIGETSDSTLRHAHAGGIFGFGSYIVRFPNDGHFIALINNTGETQLSEMVDKITCILNGKPFSAPKRSAAETFTKLLQEGSNLKAEDFYNDILERKQQDYFFNEEELNLTGYYFLGMHKLSQAIEVLRLAVIAFPKSSNVYDSLGEAYLIAGDNKLAIENYKKSLELNPNNNNAAEILKKLLQN